MIEYAEWIREQISHPRVAIYLKAVAVFMLLGALSHLASVMSVPGRPSWGTQPLYIQVLEILLLIVDLVLAALIFAHLPSAAAWAIGLLVGINMVFGGTALIAMALHARNAA